MNNALKGKIATIPQVDNTLTKAGFAADAKMVGDRLLKVSPEYAQNVIYNNENSSLKATNTQGAIDELKANVDGIEEYFNNAPSEGMYFGFAIYFGSATAGIFIPMDKYILENYTIASADNINFSGVAGGVYTVDEVSVKNNGLFVGHTFESASAAISAIKATNGLNGTTRLTFTKK